MATLAVTVAVFATALYAGRSPRAVLSALVQAVHPFHPSPDYALVTDNGRPAAWPGCATVPYVVNLAHAPANAATVLTGALATLHQLTGLTFTEVGTTSRVDFAGYATGAATPPVAIAWVPPADLLGQSGVNAVTRPYADASGQMASAVVLLGTQTNANFARYPLFARNLLLHELAHVVGLADIDDPTQIMNTTLQPSTTLDQYGAGDRAGLARLYPHPGRCAA